VAPSDTENQDEGAGTNNKSPVKDGAFVSSCQSESADADNHEQWRRRECDYRKLECPRKPNELLDISRFRQSLSEMQWPLIGR
jgi:hypothetical protein